MIGCVVAVVGGFISPVGTYLVKRAASMLSPKAALISSLGQWTEGWVFLLPLKHREQGRDGPCLHPLIEHLHCHPSTPHGLRFQLVPAASAVSLIPLLSALTAGAVKDCFRQHSRPDGGAGGGPPFRDAPGCVKNFWELDLLLVGVSCSQWSCSQSEC